MGPTVELLRPARLNLHGRYLFERGVETPVDYDLAQQLEGDDRFKVRGLNTREAVDHAARQARPRGAALSEAIREAIDRLDVDDDNAFERTGKPSVSALADVLGYPVSLEERDAAMTGAAHQEPEPAEEPKQARKVKIKRAAEVAEETQPEEPPSEESVTV